MIGWLKNTNVMEKKKIEPGATFSALEDHWKQISEVMKNSQDAEGAEIVISHLGQMISFLRLARLEAPSANSCKSFWLENRCSERVIKWLHYLQIQGVQFPSEVEKKLVDMLHSLCEVATKDADILGHISETESDGEDFTVDDHASWDGAYSLASLLLEYSLRNEGNLGETARYCFILLIQLASKYPRLEKKLTQGSGRGLTNVVISGLSACFSTLPTFTHSSRDQLRAFTTQLRFVDEVCRASSSTVALTISDCFTNAFLLPVIQPALTQDQGNSRLQNQQDPFVTSLNEEIATVTYYFQVVCEQLTHPCLIRSLIVFTNSKLLPVLINRISHQNTSIVIATLRLFNVLFEFYCEDFWYQTILCYLVPENHLMVSQRNTPLKEIDYHESSIRLLSLVPGHVIDGIGSEVLTSHYLQYLSHESERFIDTVFMLTNNTSAVPVSFSTENQTDQDECRKGNSIYPMWKHRYDGTDGKEFVSSKDVAKSNENKENEGETIAVNGETFVTSDSDPLSNSEHGQFPQETNNTTNVAVQQGHERPGSRSSSEGLPSHQIASFGQFLDSIFVQLSNWAHLDPQIILVLSELVSTIAACRIPLITTLLLDSNLTLQPYYVTFISLLKRIKEDLEFRLKNCPPSIVKEVWSKIDGTDDARRRSVGMSANSSKALSSFRSSPQSSVNDNFGEKIIKGTALISNAMQSFFTKKAPSAGAILTGSPSSSRSSLGNQSTNNNAPSLQSVGPQEYKYVVRHQNQQGEDETRKIMALRAIFFSHWIFELAAIAQELSWKNF